MLPKTAKDTKDSQSRLDFFLMDNMCASPRVALTWRCLLSNEIGLMGWHWSTRTTSCPWQWVLVQGLLKSDWVGSEVWGEDVENDGSSSPRWHWPQKAVAAHAATATSRGDSVKVSVRTLSSYFFIFACFAYNSAESWYIYIILSILESP